MNSIMLEPPSPFPGPGNSGGRDAAPPHEPQQNPDVRSVKPPRDDRHLARGFRMGDRVVMPDRGSIARAGEDAEFVERFMRDYYIHARNVLNYSSLVTEQCLARVRQSPRSKRIQRVEEGLRVVGGRLEIAVFSVPR